MTATATKFEQWAIVEIFGHQKYAGLVTEQPLGGTNMIRVEVPETDRSQAFTKFFGGSSIFSLTPVSEEIARGLAANWDKAPVNIWELPEEIQAAVRAMKKGLPAPDCEKGPIPAEACVGGFDGDELDDLAGPDDDPGF